ncbi:zinc-ribbon domain-containing protein [Virgibacillus sp. MG-45]|uniref:zinc-ribbon domain-containing protein n=1 Tax=Virgibacillus sp. MG-45 TaxID=3102791 RepID=UPI002EDAC1B4
MLFCPYCGSTIKEDETYCVSCGSPLPEDINNRTKAKKRFNKKWLLPISASILLIFSISIFFFVLQAKTSQAKEYYEQGENRLSDGDFSKAKQLFDKALQQKANFSEAEVASIYIDKVFTVQSAIENAHSESERDNFQEALSLVNEAEKTLKNYSGTAVSSIVNELSKNRDAIKLAQIKSMLNNETDINKLKLIIWEVEAIRSPEAVKITTDIREQIIDYTFSMASEQLNKKQFRDAQLIVEDGIKYASASEKLQSLKTTIEKEKVAFETTQQQRIEQAMTTAEQERKLNEKDAIKLVSVKVESDDQNKLVVNGNVKSVATVPINSIKIDYSITKNGTPFITNEVYVFPDTLYPGDNGKFEFTHYDTKSTENVKIKVDKITWYTD